jgi:hypothetical protein
VSCSLPDEGSKHFWNFGKLLPGYMALQPRRQTSSVQIFFFDINLNLC